MVTTAYPWACDIPTCPEHGSEPTWHQAARAAEHHDRAHSEGERAEVASAQLAGRLSVIRRIWGAA